MAGGGPDGIAGCMRSLVERLLPARGRHPNFREGTMTAVPADACPGTSSTRSRSVRGCPGWTAGAGEDARRRAKERKVADAHRADVQHHAVEVEEDPLAQVDVRAVVAKNGGCIHTVSPPAPNSSRRMRRRSSCSASRVAFSAWHRSRARSRPAPDPSGRTAHPPASSGVRLPSTAPGFGGVRGAQVQHQRTPRPGTGLGWRTTSGRGGLHRPPASAR
jgi:hypothetical protein